MLEGTICETSIDPSRFVISQGPICEWIPVSTIADPHEKWQVLTCTQYNAFSIDSTGVMEMDLKGIRVLSELKSAILNIKKNLGIEFNLAKIPFDDSKTFKLFQKGHTIGVFEFESHDMRAYLKHLCPTCFKDIVALNALNFPGLIDYIPSFIARRNIWKRLMVWPYIRSRSDFSLVNLQILVERRAINFKMRCGRLKEISLKA